MADVDALKTAFRPYKVDGVPASGENEPDKPEIRAGLDVLQAGLDGLVGAITDAGMVIPFATQANRDADLNHAAGTWAIVFADSTSANNGYSQKVGASGTGSWSFKGPAPGKAYSDAAAASASAAAASATAAATSASGIGAVLPTLSTFTTQTTTLDSGHYINGAGAAVANASYANRGMVLTGAEGTIEVTAFTVLTGNNLAVFYSDSGGTTFLSGSTQKGSVSGTQYTDEPVTVPPSARYVRINTTATAASASGIKTNIVAPNIATRLAAVENLGLGNVGTALTAWSTQNVTATPNFRVGSGGVVSAGTGYSYGQYQMTGTETGMRATCFVVGSGNALAYFYSDTACTTFLSASSQMGSPSGTTYTQQAITIPAGARGVRVNSGVGHQLVVDFLGIDPNAGAKIATIGQSTTWKNKVLDTFGDSITAQQMWTPQLFAKFGLLRVDNHGVAGTRIAYNHSVSDQTSCFCDDARINVLSADADLLIVMGGTNDFGQSSVLGSLQTKDKRAISDMDPYTFYGACEIMAIKLLTKYSSATQRLLWASQTYVDPGVTLPAGWTSRYLNPLGLSLHDYKKATQEVADKYGIPFLDMVRECGWSTPNIDTFVQREGGLMSWTHPNSLGGDRMAAVVYRRMLDMAPIT